MLANAVALGRADDEDVVDVPRLVLGQLADLAEPKLPIAGGRLAAEPVPLVQMRQEEPEHRGLELVEPRVVTDELELLLRLRAVEAKKPDPLGQLPVAGRDEPAVTEREQVLRREEAVRRGDAGLADARGAERLSGVLEDRHGEVDGRRPAEQVDGDDRLRLRRHPATHILWVEVQRLRVDLREDGSRSAPRNRLGGRVEREARADDLVASPDPERVQREHERVRPVRDPDRVLHAEEYRGLLFEGLDLRAEDESARVEDVGDSLLQLVKQ